MNIVALLLDDCEHNAIDSRSMPWLDSRPGGSWVELPNAVTSTPLCSPDRHTVFRGDRSDHHGQTANTIIEVPGFEMADNVGVWLAAQGWDTAFLGKMPNGFPWADFATYDPGWGRLFATPTHSYTAWTATQEDGSTVAAGGEYLTDRLRDEALDWLATVTAPFMLLIAPGAPHANPVAAARHAALDCGGATAADDPPGFNVQMANAPPHMVYPTPLTSGEQGEIRAERALDRRCLRAVDEMLAAVWAALDGRGMLPDTAWFVANDNGQSKGRHRIDQGTAAGTDTAKSRPYRWCTDAMLRVRWPGAVNRTDHRLVTTADLPVTWAAIGGATPTIDVDGIDISSLLNNTAGAGWRSSIEFLELIDGVPDIPTWHAVLYRTAGGTQHWRYVEYDGGEVELFDQNTDTAELVNVAAVPANAEVVAFLARKLRRLRARSQGQRAAA